MHVDGLQEVVVSTPEATYELFQRGSLNRTVGMTAMNAESSRSHVVFSLSVVTERRSENGMTKRCTSRFHLVDLAGSERQKRTESSGLRLKEANCINKSLSALGNVIKALVDNSEGRSCHIPYRDSKLTYLLKDALGGNSKCALIANINPGLVNIDETLSTLKFAQRAKLMHNLAILNEYDDPGSIAEELRRLRLEVTALRGKIGRVLLNDHRAPMAHEYRDRGRIRRIESMLTQLSKDAFGSGKRSADEMHALSLKVESTKALCQKLDKFLQSQKRTPGGKIANSITESTEQLLNPVTQPVNQLDSTKYDSELDLCKAKLQRYERQRRNGQLLQAQINQLESLNKTMQQGIEEILEEKRDIFAELLEMRRERDESKADIEDLKAQISNLQQSLDRYLPAKNLKENIVRRSRKTLSKAEVMSNLQQALDRCLPKKVTENILRRPRKSLTKADSVKFSSP
eukprot:Gb_25906 [translate_table: standard]